MPYRSQRHRSCVSRIITRFAIFFFLSEPVFRLIGAVARSRHGPMTYQFHAVDFLDTRKDQLEADFPDAAEHLENAADDILAFAPFPSEIWTKIWSNNPQERLNKESGDEPTSSESSRIGPRSSASSALFCTSRLTSGRSENAT